MGIKNIFSGDMIIEVIIPILPHLIITIFASSMELLASNYALSKGEHYAPMNDVIIHYIVSGSGPVCLCPSPGWDPFQSVFKNTLKPLEQYFTMVYYNKLKTDKPAGHNDAPKYTSKDFIKDIDAMRCYLKQDKIWIMGRFSGTPSQYLPG
jgi:proline iminopeptidase